MDTTTNIKLDQLQAVVVNDLDRNPTHVYLAGLPSEGSRQTMGRALDVIAEIASAGNSDRLGLDWSQLTFAHTAAIRAALIERYAPATCNRMLAALRGVLKTAWRLGLMEVETYHRAADLDIIKGETLPPGRAITPGEIIALANACPPNTAGVRDAAILGLMRCGLRRAEVAGLDVLHLVGDAVQVKAGKGRKQREVDLIPGVDAALADWLAIRGDWAGPLFVAINKAGRVGRNRVTLRAINYILENRAKLAGIAKLTPHDFRRSVIGDLLDAGVDIATVADIVGHASVETTRRYDRRGARVRRQAMNRLHYPYTRRVLGGEQ